MSMSVFQVFQLHFMAFVHFRLSVKCVTKFLIVTMLSHHNLQVHYFPPTKDRMMLHNRRLSTVSAGIQHVFVALNRK